MYISDILQCIRKGYFSMDIYKRVVLSYQADNIKENITAIFLIMLEIAGNITSQL